MPVWKLVEQPCGHICVGVDEENDDGAADDDMVIVRWNQDSRRTTNPCVIIIFRLLNVVQVAYMCSSSVYRTPLCLIHYTGTTLTHLCLEFVGSESARITVLILFILYIATASMLALILQSLYIACLVVAYIGAIMLYYVDGVSNNDE